MAAGQRQNVPSSTTCILATPLLIVRNLLYALVAAVLIKPAYILFIDRGVQLQVGDAAYGRYAALLNLAYVFGVVLDFGLANYATARISASPGALYSTFKPLLRARLALCVVYAAAVLSAGAAFGFGSADLALLAGILAVQALAQTTLFVRACVAALQRFRTDALLSIADRALLLLLGGALLLSGKSFGIGVFVGLQAVCYAIALGGAWRVLQRAAPCSLPQAAGRSGVWEALRNSVPYAGLIVLMAIYTRADMLLVERLPRIAGASMHPPASEAGFYAAAYRLLDMGNMAGLTIVSVLLPLFGRLISTSTPVGPAVRAGVALLLPASVFACAAVALYSEPVARMLYPQSALQVAPLLGILMAAFPAFCISNVYSTLLTAAGRLSLLIWLAAGGAILNVAANWLLVPRYGVAAAAAVALATQWGVAIAYAIAATIVLRLRVDARWAGRHSLFGVGVLGAAWLLSRLPSAPDWRVGTGVLAILAAILFFILRLATLNQVRRLFRKADG